MKTPIDPLTFTGMIVKLSLSGGRFCLRCAKPLGRRGKSYFYGPRRELCSPCHHRVQRRRLRAALTQRQRNFGR